MTWEWVTLILGLFGMVMLLFGFVAWTTMKTKINESIPKTLPDMLTASKQTQQKG